MDMTVPADTKPADESDWVTVLDQIAAQEADLDARQQVAMQAFQQERNYLGQRHVFLLGCGAMMGWERPAPISEPPISEPAPNRAARRARAATKAPVRRAAKNQH